MYRLSEAVVTDITRSDWFDETLKQWISYQVICVKLQKHAINLYSFNRQGYTKYVDITKHIYFGLQWNCKCVPGMFERMSNK